MGFDMMAREMDEDYGIDISIYGLFSPSPNSALSSHIHNIKIHKNHGKRFRFQVQRQASWKLTTEFGTKIQFIESLASVSSSIWTEFATGRQQSKTEISSRLMRNSHLKF